MRTVHEFPHRVREIENLWIPMSDGARLAARAWIPETAVASGAGSATSVPAVVEYIPYRKRDGTRWRDEPMHRYFAGHGLASLRIDLRGSGDSDGLLLDEYLEQEQLDGVEALRWIGAQSWCSGKVGMIGKSWGGFNALQVAALAPPELGGVISVCSTDDRYADDAHYMGGCLLNENLTWGSMLLTINAFPPDPAIVGARWRDMWLERLRAAPLFPATWLRHPRRDAYWKHGSVCEDFSRIACPVLAVGGWADGYSNAVPRLLSGLSAPRRGIVGPWAHLYPHRGVPGPAIGFLQVALAWWRRWLGGEEDAMADEPLYRAWMQESVAPSTFHATRPGRWIAERAWPSERIRPRVFALAPGALVDEGAGPDGPGAGAPLVFRSSQLTGLDAGSWCGFGMEGEAPGDQRGDDATSLLFDSEPLTERTEILGAAVLTIELAVDRPLAFLVARLNDVLPDGRSARVTFGLLNLTHRAGHEHPEPLVPGRRTRVELRLNDAAHAFPAGHRVRLALSTSYWPMVWPSPHAVELTVFPSASRFRLPVRPPCADDEDLPRLPPPEAATGPAVTELTPPVPGRRIERDPSAGEVVYALALDLDEEGKPALERLDDIGLVYGHSVEERFSLREDDPLSASAEARHRAIHRRGDWSTRVETSTRLSATADAFVLEAEQRAFEGSGDGEREASAREWTVRVPRDSV
jgi:hypothetical protein